MIVPALFVLQRKIDLRILFVYQLKLSLTHECQNPTIEETHNLFESSWTRQLVFQFSSMSVESGSAEDGVLKEYILLNCRVILA